jgi:hypothetical protein
MSLFGLSVSDIIAAIKIAHKIWDTWFDKIKRAGSHLDILLGPPRADSFVDAQYLDFGKEVAQFATLLKSFSAAFEKACQIRGRQLSASEFKEWDAQSYRERQAIAGSFNSTLEECHRLLQQNTKYLSKGSLQVWDNARWHLGGSSDAAERLRKRLQLHAAKVLPSHVPL